MERALVNSTNNKITYNNNIRLLIQNLINHLPGIRYNDIVRITNCNNGVISYSLLVLEKNHRIKVVKCSNGKITRYFSISIPDEHCPIIGYLKNETTRKIILLLHYRGKSNFKQLKIHIHKASSTTFWNLKRLVDDDVISKFKTKNNYCYIIKNPILVTKVLQDIPNLLLDRDGYQDYEM